MVIWQQNPYFFSFHLKNHIQLSTLFKSHVTKIICVSYLLLCDKPQTILKLSGLK